MNKKLLFKTAKLLTPIGIFLRTTTIFVEPTFQPRHDKFELKVEYKDRHLNDYKLLTDEDERNNVVSFQYEAAVRLVDDNLDQANVHYVKVEIIAIFTSEYQISKTSDFDEQDMSKFHTYNVRHHVWPYWREYVQSTCARMGLPVICVPHQFHPQTNDQ